MVIEFYHTCVPHTAAATHYTKKGMVCSKYHIVRPLKKNYGPLAKPRETTNLILSKGEAVT